MSSKFSNQGNPPKRRQALALIAAGTGLGEGILFWDGKSYRPMPSEGGHTDFAPTNDYEIELLRYLRSQYLHVSYERLLSGPGLHAIYEFIRDTKKNEPTWLAEKIKAGNPAAEIAEAGLKHQAEIATQTLDLFASIYGAEAGNLALKALSLDGVYVAGGIAPKLIGKLKDGTFMKAFTNKGRYKRLLSNIPVNVVMNQETGLLGPLRLPPRSRRLRSHDQHRRFGRTETIRGPEGGRVRSGWHDPRAWHRFHRQAPGARTGR